MMNSLFASTAHGLEELLKSELEALGAVNSKIVQGGVHYQGDDSLLYRSLLWSRLAVRIFLPLNEFKVYSDLDLYAGVNLLDWPALFSVQNTFSVQFTGVNEEIRNSQYGALKVKDAIVDSFTRRTGQRPNVDKQDADIRIHLFLQKEKAILSIDLSGDSLHQRGYRSRAGQAPLKEHLAAAIVLRSGWKQETPLIDPMCGSGTLLIEAAMMAADVAPGLSRTHWGFFAWSGFNAPLWQQIKQEAEQRAIKGKQQVHHHFYGYDIDRSVLQFAKENAHRAGVDDMIHFQAGDVRQLKNPLPSGPTGTVISNPPYGKRLESETALIALHSQLGRIMKNQFAGWRLSLFSAEKELLDCLQLRAERQFKAKNGPLECVQKNYLLSAEGNSTASSDIAPDFANRLRKNIRKLEKWAKKEGVQCYRLYDADLPEYNVAIDRYGQYVVLQEYAPPKTVDAQKARQRLFDIINATLTVLEIPSQSLLVKTRRQQKGKDQYEKLSSAGEFLQVSEYYAKFLVNLTDYLDTGLFLDHRLARKMIGEMSRGKDFLNLFAYTGTATVYAGLGGARSTTTVDMSRNYLEWAEKNLQLNHLTGRQHRLIQADCLSWLENVSEQFDLIFVDPPTFSNSKRMEKTFDVQRDHISLLKQLKRLLRKHGSLLFSNNKRGFQMDTTALKEIGLIATEITAKTQSMDFIRNRQIHNCWLLQHAGEEK